MAADPAARRSCTESGQGGLGRGCAQGMDSCELSSTPAPAAVEVDRAVGGDAPAPAATAEGLGGPLWGWEVGAAAAARIAAAAISAVVGGLGAC